MLKFIKIYGPDFVEHSVPSLTYRQCQNDKRLLVVTGALFDDEAGTHLFPEEKLEAVGNIFEYAFRKEPCTAIQFHCYDAYASRVSEDVKWRAFLAACETFRPTHILWTDIWTYKVFIRNAKKTNPHLIYFGLKDHALVQKAMLPIGSKGSEVEVFLSGTVPLHDVVTDNPKFFKTLPNLAGYVVGSIERLLHGGHPYPINVTLAKIKKNIKIVTNKKELDEAFAVLEKSQTPCFDIEADSLGRFRNVLFSVQFTVDGKVPYIIPFAHPGSPLSPALQKQAAKRLRDYFEKGTSKYLILHNAKFDLTVMRIVLNSLGVRFYNHAVYDTMAGEFFLDENGKFLERYKVSKEDKASFFSLDSIALRYGCAAYHTLSVKKHQRANMADVPFDQFAIYGCADVLVTYGIAKSQFKVAEDAGFETFETFMVNQFSDMHLAFVDLEHNGIRIDRKWLYSLAAPTSPINEIIKQEKQEFYSLPEVKDYSAARARGKATRSLFGDPVAHFNMDKPDQVRDFFFNWLKLEPVAFTPKGVPSTGKLFLKAYKDHPVASIYKKFKDAVALKNSSVNVVFRFMTESDDCRFDARLRPSVGFTDVVTGRTSIRNPSLQNVPEHNPQSKFIKRYFISEPGNALAEYDYNAHEIRMWGNVARDPQIAAAFYEGLKARTQQRILMYKNDRAWQAWKAYVKNSKEKDAKGKDVTIVSRTDWTYEQKVEQVKNDLKGDARRIGLLDLFIRLKADIHIQNVKIIFGKDITKEDPLRSDVKSLIFGAIYGMSIPTLANNLKKTEDETQALYDLIFKEKFKVGGAYLQRTISRIRKTYYNVSPIGRMRHFWGYLHWKRSIHNAMDRRGPNSEIQGLASDIGCAAMRKTAQSLWHFFNKYGDETGKILSAKIVNYVHDSVKGEGPIATLPIFLYLMEHAATTLIHRHYRKTYGFEMLVGLEVEFHLGFSKSALDVWSFSYRDIPEILRETATVLDRQKLPDFEEALAKCAHNARLIEALRLEELEKSLESTAPCEIMALTPKLAQSLDFAF